MSKKSLKRLGKEFKVLKEKASSDEYAGSVSVDMIEDSLTKWKITFGGPKEVTLSSGEKKTSPYSGRKFVSEIDFPADYPFVRPNFVFKGEEKDGAVSGKPPLNPHIDDAGEVCQGLFGEWAPTKKVPTDIIPVIFQVISSFYYKQPKPNIYAQ